MSGKIGAKSGYIAVEATIFRVATVREKCLENEIFSRSGKIHGILWMAREIWKGLGKSGKSQGF